MRENFCPSVFLRLIYLREREETGRGKNLEADSPLSTKPDSGINSGIDLMTHEIMT